MFSGCRDEQTSADAQICGTIDSLQKCMLATDTFQALHATRALLKASAYTQVTTSQFFLCIIVADRLCRFLSFA
ncbi:hypothetical protein D6D17_06706 [Aureobasidium pullulans]|nr:hypothetical protein D6D17_06706 [Aureobasidium pullulans]